MECHVIVIPESSTLFLKYLCKFTTILFLPQSVQNNVVGNENMHHTHACTHTHSIVSLTTHLRAMLQLSVLFTPEYIRQNLSKSCCCVILYARISYSNHVFPERYNYM